MRIGVDLDDVIAICAVPYLRRFAQEYKVELPDDKEIGWHLLRDMDKHVSAEERDRFRIKLYDGTFFSQLEIYKESPAVLERLVQRGDEIFFITARTERRRMVTETWLREKRILDYAKAVHLKPYGDFRPDQPRGRYDPEGSAAYKMRLRSSSVSMSSARTTRSSRRRSRMPE
jgi:5'(3')-deoxyribonucleotidase